MITSAHTRNRVEEALDQKLTAGMISAEEFAIIKSVMDRDTLTTLDNNMHVGPQTPPTPKPRRTSVTRSGHQDTLTLAACSNPRRMSQVGAAEACAADGLADELRVVTLLRRKESMGIISADEHKRILAVHRLASDALARTPSPRMADMDVLDTRDVGKGDETKEEEADLRPSSREWMETWMGASGLPSQRPPSRTPAAVDPPPHTASISPTLPPSATVGRVGSLVAFSPPSPRRATLLALSPTKTPPTEDMPVQTVTPSPPRRRDQGAPLTPPASVPRRGRASTSTSTSQLQESRTHSPISPAPGRKRWSWTTLDHLPDDATAVSPHRLQKRRGGNAGLEAMALDGGGSPGPVDTLWTLPTPRPRSATAPQRVVQRTSF
eukprot:m.113538 g.113538  ORF g.113538 m.113538 type:complete len:380 (+) comp10808_c0_seq1:446-1585(+)